jgi:hypothetical protein
MFLKITFNFIDRSIGSSSFHDSEPSEVVYRTVSRRMGAEPQKIEMIFDLSGVRVFVRFVIRT